MVPGLSNAWRLNSCQKPPAVAGGSSPSGPSNANVGEVPLLSFRIVLDATRGRDARGPRSFRQRLNEMIEAQPNAPAMVIEGQGKYDRNDEEERENELNVVTDDWQTKEIDRQNRKFRRDHVDQNRAHEKSFLTIEHHRTERTLIFYLEWALDY